MLAFKSIIMSLLLTATIGCTTTPDSNSESTGDVDIEKITIGKFDFDVRVGGPKNGELVILLHGFPQTSFSFRHQIKALARAGYRAIAPDQRGYSPGASPYEISNYQITNLVNDVLEIAKSQNANSFHLVGHDWGAGVAWALAASHPEKVKTLTALSIPHPRAFNEAIQDPQCEQARKSSYIKTFIQENSENILLKANKSGLRMIYRDLPEIDRNFYLKALGTQPTLRTALNWYRANFSRPEDQEIVGPVQAKTLLIWGAKDPAVGACGVKRTHQYVQKGKLTVQILPKAGHWLLESNSDDISSWLLDHIKP